MLRKAMSAVAVLTMALGVAVASATTSTAAVDGNFVFSCSGGDATISGYTGPSGALTIPDELTDGVTTCDVTAIGVGAFSGKGLTSVSLPTTLTTIGQQAFISNALTTITIPDSVTTMGAYAFRANALTTATIGDSLTSIPFGAFQLNQLTSVSIGNSVTSIGDFSFAGSNLSSVTIPASVTIIGNNAFAENALSSVTVPSNVTTIGSYAFSANNLTSVSLPGSLTTIGQYAFSDNGLTSVTIPDSVTDIQYAAFFRNALTSLTIPASVTTIGTSAFQSNNLSSVTFLGPVANVAVTAFNSQSGVGGVSRWYTTTDGISTRNPIPSPVTGALTFYASADALPQSTVTFDSNGGSAVADQSVVEGWAAVEPTAPTRSDYTFAGWFDADGIEWDFATIPTADVALTAAWDSDLYYSECDADGNATILSYTGPDGVAVDIPAELTLGLDTCTVTTLGESSFWGHELTEVTIPNTVTTIGKDAFYINAITSVTIPDSVTFIAYAAFAYNELTTVTIPDSITGIEDFAFFGNKLESLTIPSSVTSIGVGAFGTNNLAAVTIPSSVTFIDSEAFSTNEITSVTFEGAGATVDPDAFSLQFESGQPSYWYTTATGGAATTYIPSPVPAPATYTTQPIGFMVTFDSDGGTVVDSQYVIEGDSAFEPLAPFLPGHTFTGWVDGDDAAWDFATLLTADITLTATYTANTPTFTIPASARPGDTITITGSGFDPNEQVTVELHSTPVALGTVTASASGEISATVVIPVDAEVGQHSIVIIAAAGTFTSPFTIAAATDSEPSESPSPTPSEGPSENPSDDPSPTPSSTVTPAATDDELSSTGPSLNTQLALVAVLVLINAGMVLVVINGRHRA